jgi:hypothetical protein
MINIFNLNKLTGDKIVAVFITRVKGEELAALVDNGTRVMMQITVGSHYTYRFTNINR